MKGLVATLYVAVFLALFGLDYAISRYYTSTISSEVEQSYPGYRAALKLAAQHLAPIIEDEQRRNDYIQKQQINLAIEPTNAVPLPVTLATIRDQGEIITLASASTISLYQKVDQSKWLLRLDLAAEANNFGKQRNLGLTILFYSGVAAILLLWVAPLLRDIRQLNRAAKKMGKGQLETRVATGYGDHLRPVKTEFNAMAAKLQRLNENNQLLTQAVSHELRTPLSRMRFALDLLENRENKAQRQKDITRIEADMDAMELLISELLNYARLDQAPKLQYQLVEVEALIAERIALHQASPQHGDGHGQHLIHFDSQQPHNTASLDPEYFSKVLDNLIQNACRYAHSKVKIHCDWSNNKQFTLSIEDDGPGIPEEKRESIFKPFVRLRQCDGDNNDSENFGLGLAIVERVIHWHGGHISVKTARLGGCLFQLQWPLKKLNS